MGNRAGNAVNKKSGTDHNSDGRKRKEPNKRLQKEEPAEAERHHESPVIKVNILKPELTNASVLPRVKDASNVRILRGE